VLGPLAPEVEAVHDLDGIAQGVARAELVDDLGEYLADFVIERIVSGPSALSRNFLRYAKSLPFTNWIRSTPVSAALLSNSPSSFLGAAQLCQR
jgi:hypothetical protein